MSSLRFYLDKPRAGAPDRHALYLRYKTPAGSCTFYPGTELTLERWDAKAQRVRGTSLDAKKLNKDLQAYRLEIEDAADKLHALVGRDPAPAALQAAVKLGKEIDRVGPVPVGTPQCLPALVRHMVTLRRGELTRDTASQYEQVARRLEAMQPAHAWQLDALQPLYLEAWRQWLVTVPGPKKQSGNVTANNRVKLLLSCLNYFRKRDGRYRAVFTEDHLQALGRFKTVKSVRQSLTAAELRTFYDAPLPRGARASAVLMRDVYCLGWYTSLRQSDMFAIERAHIVFDKYGVPEALNTTSIKSLTVTRLPLRGLAVEIIQRWLDRTRPEIAAGTLWGDHLNRYNWPADRLFPFVGGRRKIIMRKLWAKMGLFTEPVEVVSLSGVKQQRTLVPRYELLTLHTARHGFGNFMAANNVPIGDAQLLMGHASSKTTEIYYHRPEEQAFERAAEAFELLGNRTP